MGAGWGKRYYWDFGDGTKDTVNTFIFNKQYAIAGDYIVRLVMLGSDGCYDTMSTRISVKALPCTGVIFYLQSQSNLKEYKGINSPSKIASGVIANKEVSQIGLTLYPNPSSGEITLAFDSPIFGKTQIAVIDVLGREVYSEERMLSNSKDIQINNLQVTNGSYYIILKTDQGYSGRKQVTIIK